MPLFCPCPCPSPSFSFSLPPQTSALATPAFCHCPCALPPCTTCAHCPQADDRYPYLSPYALKMSALRPYPLPPMTCTLCPLPSALALPPVCYCLSHSHPMTCILCPWPSALALPPVVYCPCSQPFKTRTLWPLPYALALLSIVCTLLPLSICSATARCLLLHLPLLMYDLHPLARAKLSLAMSSLWHLSLPFHDLHPYAPSHVLLQCQRFATAPVPVLV